MALHRTQRDLPFTELEKEMFTLLEYIDSEWRSDPSSVASFDARILAHTTEVLRMYREQELRYRATVKNYRANPITNY
jgi:hypothetical protein